MADIAGSYSSNQSYNPKFNYSISYSEIGRSGSAVSYRFNVSFSKANGWYGYDININWNIGGATGSKQIKSTADVSSGSTSFDVTCSTNAAGGTVSARIYTSSNSDGTHWQNSMDTGSRTANKSTFNTAPSISGTVAVSPSGTIPENTSSIKVTAPTATDPNGNLSGYRCRVSVNGGGYNEVYRGASREFNYNCSGYGEGTTFQFCFDCYDSYGLWSGNVYSGVVTKNRFSQSTILTSGSIKYTDGNGSLAFSITGADNTNGNSTFSRQISCDGITIYNNNVGTGTVTLTIYRTGATPSGPYIKFDDIKNRFSGSSFKGSLVFRVYTTNAYGNQKSWAVTVSVDLRTNPNPVTSCTIVENSTSSTAYRQVASTKNWYFLPDGSRTIQINWAGGDSKLNDETTYNIYVSYGGGGWQLLSERMPLKTKAFTHTPPKQSASQSIRYRIRVVTSYGYYVDTDSALKTLHYYNSPGLSQGAITRGATNADVIVTVKSNSSIPNINTKGSWVCYNKGTTTKISEGTLTVAQTAQTLKVTGLTDNGQYDLKVTYNDDTGFSGNVIATIAIGANSPIFFVNKYGAGVNGVKATATYPLLVNGSLGLTLEGLKAASGIFMYPGDANGAGMAIQSGGTVVIGSGESPKNFIETIENKANEITYITSDSSIEFVTNCQTIANKKTASLYRDGTFNALNLQVNGNNVYHTGRKPSASDVGALPIGGGTLTGPLYIGNGLSASGANNTAYSRIVRASADKGSSMKLQFGNGESTFEIVDKGWSKALFQVTSAGWIGTQGTEIVGYSNDGGTRNWVRFYDGTQICWGKHVHSDGDINMQTNIANNTVYGGVNINIYYPVTFTTTPNVQLSVSTNAYTCCQATGIATNLFTARAWGNYASIPNHLYFFWLAVGRWK